jgi:hypothetical protein
VAQKVIDDSRMQWVKSSRDARVSFHVIYLFAYIIEFKKPHPIPCHASLVAKSVSVSPCIVPDENRKIVLLDDMPESNAMLKPKSQCLNAEDETQNKTNSYT